KKLPKISISKHKLWEDPPPPESPTQNSLHPNNNIIEIDPNEVMLWDYKDRPENELGDLNEFARVLREVGQLQPGIIRLSNKPEAKYELLVGERRWRACKIAGILFQARLTSYSNTEAGLAQAIENDEREKLSDYAKGINYARQIEAGILKQSDLVDKLGASKQLISKLLSYREIPTKLMEAIGDMTKVSPHTAEEMKLICKRDPDGLEILLNIADRIRSGIGHNTLKKHYTALKSPPLIDIASPRTVTSGDGRRLFNWRKDGNGNLSISFPQDIRAILNIQNLENSIKTSIEEQIKNPLSRQRDI
ncbi:MAG: ParB/RepB/Spo0J family partition protein, partial [Gammaproteobacteria bacterium]|nr:ParB/RepB/Spo0J family partition protein [Gammaproteobacteria bacterium]